MSLTNLFIGYNRKEDFRILVCADDEFTASEKAEEYRIDAGLEGEFEIEEMEDKVIAMHFDCDYVIA